MVLGKELSLEMLPFIFCQLSRELAAAASPPAAGGWMTHVTHLGQPEQEIPYKIARGSKKKDHNKILNKFPFNLFDHSTLRGYELLKFDNKYSIQLIM